MAFDNADIATRIASAGVGGEVVLPDGNYSITSAVFPLAGQTLRGVSRGGVTFTKAANTDLIEVNVNGVFIDGLRFDGAYNFSTVSGRTGQGIYAHGVSGLRVNGCWLTNIYTGGIVMTSTKGSRITGNTIDLCGNGSVYGTPNIFGNFDCLDHTVSGNTITMHSGGPHAIAFHTEQSGHRIRQIRIADNQIINNGGGYCIEVGSFAGNGGDPERPHDVRISGNTMSQSADCSGGISLDWVDSATISCNFYRSSGGTATAGIECVNGRYILIDQNQIYGGGTVSIGIALDHEGSYIQVTNNIICDILATSQGKYIAARADAALSPGTSTYRNVTISGNFIEAPTGADGDGIRIILQDANQILENIQIAENNIIWKGLGGNNSSAVVLGTLATRNPYMRNNIVRDNYFTNTHFGMYLQGFIGGSTPLSLRNTLSGVSVTAFVT